MAVPPPIIMGWRVWWVQNPLSACNLGINKKRRRGFTIVFASFIGFEQEIFVQYFVSEKFLNLHKCLTLELKKTGMTLNWLLSVARQL